MTKRYYSHREKQGMRFTIGPGHTIDVLVSKIFGKRIYRFVNLEILDRYEEKTIELHADKGWYDLRPDLRVRLAGDRKPHSKKGKEISLQYGYDSRYFALKIDRRTQA